MTTSLPSGNFARLTRRTALLGGLGAIAACATAPSSNPSRSATPSPSGSSSAAVSSVKPTSATPTPSAPSSSASATPSATQSSEPSPSAAGSDWAKVQNYWKDDQLIAWDGKVDHVFFHDLIPFPKTAFATSIGQDFDDWYLTKTEAERVLKALHAGGFCLVPMDKLFVKRAGKMVTNTDLRVPKGKKPLVISIDDMSFNKFLLGKGFMDKLFIDDEGRPSAMGTDPETGKKVVDPTNTMVGLIDDFILRHPDFSLNGASGTLALTGYEGILGYRTNRQEHNKKSERAKAAVVVAGLKKRGWTFACHSYGHFNLADKKMSLGWVKDDTRKWLKEVGSLVGPTKEYITPFGAYAAKEGPMMQHIYNAGFTVICPVSDRTTDSPLDSQGAMYQTRLHIDGHGLRYSPHIYKGFFSPEEIFDKEHRLEKWRRKGR